MMLGRLEKSKDSAITVSLVLEPKPTNEQEVALHFNGKTERVEVSTSGELKLPPMADLIKDVNSELLISRSNTDPSIKARLNIILDTNQWITYTRLREIVSQYQELGKSLYGWASFLIPELDCLTLEYTEAEDPGSTAELRSSQGQVKLIPNRFKRIHINLADAPVDLLLTRVPAWAWGCKYARWSGDK